MRTPKRTTLGTDVAGTVEAVGTKVTRFHPGDEVLGATVPIAALTALQALRDKGKLLAETPDALRHLEAGHTRGKLVVTT